MIYSTTITGPGLPEAETYRPEGRSGVRGDGRRPEMRVYSRAERARVGGGVGNGAGEPVAYEAGRQNRRDLDFNPRPIGVNRLADETLPLLRRRVRWLVDNNPIMKGARKVICKNVVGTGIGARPNTQWDEVNEQIDTLFREASKTVDVERGKTLAMSQRAFLREVFSGGECGVYVPVADAFKGHGRGPAIELIEEQRVDFTHTEFRNGRRVRQGVHFDIDGRRIGYTVLDDDPADVGIFGGGMMPRRRTIGYEEMTLGFIELQEKQIRGVPWCVSVVSATRMEDAFQEAHLLLSRAAACVGLYLEGVDTADVMAKNDEEGSAALVDVDGLPIEKLYPGAIGMMPAGVKPHMLNPGVDGGALEKVEGILLRRIATGLDISYSSLSKDYARATFSSERASQLGDRKGYRPLQEFVWICHTVPFYEALVAWWIASNQITLTADQRRVWITDPRSFFKVEKLAPGWEWVNPDQESKADALAVDKGFKSTPEVCAARGRHWRDVQDEQLAYEQREKERRQELGLAKAAATQIDPSPPAPEEEPVGDDENDKEKNK